MAYRNPVIPGYYPDPSICRVGADYYLVNSTFEYFPGVPVHHSRDLVNWRTIGHCLTRPSQLPLEKAHFSAGIFAPTIRHHGGRFYMITTNVSVGKHLIVTAEDPAGEWSEPVWVQHGAIDPSLFFDEDGLVYLTTNGAGGIIQTAIDPATGKLLSETKVLWAGTGGQFPEGPHLYKIGGVYYLLIAEGGTEYGHMVTLARGASPWGPFEPCPHNPLLTHRSLQNPIQCTGHADLLEDHTGRWWLVFLGTRPKMYPPVHVLGRETFLAPVTWTADGWPVVNGGQPVTLEMPDATLPAHPWPAAPDRDDFDAPAPDARWNFLRNPRGEDWSLAARPGWLRLCGSTVSLDDEDSPAWLGRRQQHHRCRFAAWLEFQPDMENEEAGITAYMNPRHHYEIGLALRKGRKRVFVRRRIGSLQAVVADFGVPRGPIQLVIEATDDTYRFRFALPGQAEIEVAAGEARYLGTEVAGGFTGVYFGLYASGNGCRSTVPADFDWAEYREQA